MSNTANVVSERDSLIVNTILATTSMTFEKLECETSRNNNAQEIKQILLLVDLLDKKTLCKEDLDYLEKKIELSYYIMLNEKIAALDKELKKYIGDYFVGKPDLGNMSKSIITWAKENLATKEDLTKFELRLVWKFIAATAAIVAVTTYVVNSFK